MEERLVQVVEEFQNNVSANIQAFTNQYIQCFGRHIDTDKARELCPEYASSYEDRALLAPLIHESASKIAKAVWRSLLDESFGRQGVVMFLAGGPGSGKSTVVRSEKFQEYYREAIVVYDSTFSSIDSASQKIQEALEAGKDIDIYYVHRNAKDAAYSVVIRAVETGRTVPIQEIANLHWGAQSTIFMLCFEHRRSEDITIHLINNSGDPEAIDWFSDEASFLTIRYPTIMKVEELVKSGAKAAYDRVRQDSGSFSPAIARGIFGTDRPF